MNFFPRSTFPFLMLLLIFTGSGCLARQNPADDQEQTGPTRATVITADEKVVPAPQLPDLGPAPELENEIWLNTAQPLRLADLRGQVVLLEMWTFG